MTRKKDLKKRVRARQRKTGEKYAEARSHVVDAASDRKATKRFFDDMAERMRRSRGGWEPGPQMDAKTWVDLPEVPIEHGTETPVRPHFVVDLGSLECPADEAVRCGAVSEHSLSGGREGSIFLGTVTIEDEKGQQTKYRVPPPLGAWVAGQIGLTRQGMGQFPDYVGFCSPHAGYYGVCFLPPPAPPPDVLDAARSAIKEWQELDELAIKEIQEPSQQGSRYEVLKTGAYFVPNVAFADSKDDEQAVRAAETKNVLMSVKRRPRQPDNKSATEQKSNGMTIVALPTITVWTLAGPILYRLPLALAPWVIMTLDMAKQGHKLFPDDVEFCLIGGRYTADFV